MLTELFVLLRANTFRDVLLLICILLIVGKLDAFVFVNNLQDSAGESTACQSSTSSCNFRSAWTYCTTTSSSGVCNIILPHSKLVDLSLLGQLSATAQDRLEIINVFHLT